MPRQIVQETETNACSAEGAATPKEEVKISAAEEVPKPSVEGDAPKTSAEKEENVDAAKEEEDDDPGYEESAAGTKRPKADRRVRRQEPE